MCQSVSLRVQYEGDRAIVDGHHVHHGAKHTVMHAFRGVLGAKLGYKPGVEVPGLQPEQGCMAAVSGPAELCAAVVARRT